MDSDPAKAEAEAEAEAEKPSTPPKLPLFSAKATAMNHPGLALTPPHQSSLSVPFRWEEEPGKPRRPCGRSALLQNDAVSVVSTRSLELPPRLLAKQPSPTTVLDGPYALRSSSSSFRAAEEWPSLGALALRRSSRGGFRAKSWLGSWTRRAFALKGSGGNNKEVSGGSYVFPHSGDGESGESVKMARIRRAGSFSTLTYQKSHFWGTIYEGLKQAVPWKTKKLKKGI